MQNRFVAPVIAVLLSGFQAPVGIAEAQERMIDLTQVIQPTARMRSGNLWYAFMTPRRDPGQSAAGGGMVRDVRLDLMDMSGRTWRRRSTA